MTTANLKPAPTATTPADDATPRGWPGLKCWECGGEDCVTVNLADAELYCSGCQADLDAADCRRQAERWLAVLGWIATMPPAEAP